MKLITILIDILLGCQAMLASGKDKLKHALMGIVWVLASIAIVSVLLLAAAGFFLFGLYHYLILHMPLPVATLLVSVTALLLAGIVTGLLKWQAEKRTRH